MEAKNLTHPEPMNFACAHHANAPLRLDAQHMGGFPSHVLTHRRILSLWPSAGLEALDRPNRHKWLSASSGDAEQLVGLTTGTSRKHTGNLGSFIRKPSDKPSSLNG